MLKYLDKKNDKIKYSQKAFIFNEKGQILILRISKSHPNKAFMWDLPGGILEYGEGIQEGIKREIKEETGLENLELKVCDIVSGFDFNNSDKFWVTGIFTSKINSAEINLSYEHDEYKWIKPEEFDDLKIADKSKKIIDYFINNFLREKCYAR